MSRVECEECGGLVPVVKGVTEPHGVWVRRVYGLVESDRPCPGSLRWVAEDQVPPSVAAMVLLSRASADQLRCSPRGFVRTVSGCPVSAKAWQECVSRQLVIVTEARHVAPTEAGWRWLGEQGPAATPAPAPAVQRQRQKRPLLRDPASGRFLESTDTGTGGWGPLDGPPVPDPNAGGS